MRMILARRPLLGVHVRLEPARDEHRADMRDVLASDPDNWTMQTVSNRGTAN